MFRFRLMSGHNQVELVASGSGSRLPFQVLGPTTEAAYVEELLDERFGALTINPRELYTFLETDAWIQEKFHELKLLEGQLESSGASSTVKPAFHAQPLGEKLVDAGLLRREELEELLLDYQPYAQTQRFGEFLRLNLRVSSELLDFLINPTIYGQNGFNEKRLGERLVALEIITEDDLASALEIQKREGGRIGEILASEDKISELVARFFSQAHINANKEIIFESDPTG